MNDLEPQNVTVKKEAFLEMFVQVPNILRCAEKVGINRKAHYDWMKDDPEYPARFLEAKRKAIEHLEGSLMCRGVEMSDTAAIFLLKSLKPETYAERKTIDLNVLQSMPAEKLVELLDTVEGDESS